MVFSNNKKLFLGNQLAEAEKQVHLFKRYVGTKGITASQKQILTRKLAVYSEYATKLKAQNAEAKDSFSEMPQDLHNTILNDLNTPTDSLKMLISLSDPNARDENGMTLLMHAALVGNAKTVQIFLDKGVEVNAFDKNGHNALWHAAHAHNYAAMLLLAPQSDVNHKYVDTGDTVAHELVKDANKPGYYLKSSDLQQLALPEKAIFMGNGNLNIDGDFTIQGDTQGGIRAVDGYSTRQDSILKLLTVMEGQGLDLRAQNFASTTVFALAEERDLRYLAKGLTDKGLNLVAKEVEAPAGVVSPLFQVLLDLVAHHKAGQSIDEDIEKCKKLLENPELQDINIANKAQSGHTPFTFATNIGLVGIAQMMAEHPNFNLYIGGPNNQSTIQWPICSSAHLANRDASIKLLESLLATAKADEGVLTKELECDALGMTSLAWVAKNHNYPLKILDLLIRAGEDLNFVAESKAITPTAEIIYHPKIKTDEGILLLTHNMLALAIDSARECWTKLCALSAEPDKNQETIKATEEALALQHAKAERIFYSDLYNGHAFVDSRGYTQLHWLGDDPKSARMMHDLLEKHKDLIDTKSIVDGTTTLDAVVGYWKIARNSPRQDLKLGFEKIIVELIHYGATINPAYDAIPEFKVLHDDAEAMHTKLMETDFAGEVLCFHDADVAA